MLPYLFCRKKHRKNCECCHHHSLFKGHNVIVHIVVLNCQKCNQCLKCHVSGHKNFQKLSKIFRNCQKLSKIVKYWQQLSKIVKIVKKFSIVKNFQKISKLSKIVKIKKLSKIVKIVQKLQNFQKNSKNC